MTALHALQQQFQTALLHDQSPAQSVFTPRGDAQFGIYRNAYRARLRSALRENFEVLPLVMGDQAFDALADAYIDAHPSRHYSLRWFGHQLGDFMAAQESLVPHPAMRDVARMEWALRNAFDAASADPLAPSALASVPGQDWPELRFTLHPTAQVLDLQWAIGPVWHALKDGQDDVPAPEALDHMVLVWRNGLHTQWKSLSDAESAFVRSLQAGHTFGELCEALAAVVGEDNAAQTAALVLRECMGSGLLGDLQTPTAAV